MGKPIVSSNQTHVHDEVFRWGAGISVSMHRSGDHYYAEGSELVMALHRVCVSERDEFAMRARSYAQRFLVGAAARMSFVRRILRSNVDEELQMRLVDNQTAMQISLGDQSNGLSHQLETLVDVPGWSTSCTWWRKLLAWPGKGKHPGRKCPHSLLKEMNDQER